MSKTGISWTDATWNPVTGCSRVSPGCAHCYAFQLHDQRHEAWKAGRWPGAAPQYRRPFSDVQLFPDRLGDPFRWRTPRRVFVCSMADLFHEDVPDSFLLEVWLTMALASDHTFQVLTKRPERMRDYLVRLAPVFADTMWPLPNVWVGTSVENQHWANERVPVLLQTPAAVRFLSCEPLLGLVDLAHVIKGAAKDARPADLAKPWEIWLDGLDWIIAGGESGPKARPCDLDWLRWLRDQCEDGGVAFHLKQLGGARASGPAFLDGVEHKEFPK